MLGKIPGNQFQGSLAFHNKVHKKRQDLKTKIKLDLLRIFDNLISRYVMYSSLLIMHWLYFELFTKIKKIGYKDWNIENEKGIFSGTKEL